jgi:hypothetical protein
MDERSAGLRREAAKCLELSRIAISPIVRQEMIAMASRLHEIASSTPADFGVILQAVNDEYMDVDPRADREGHQPVEGNADDKIA